MKRALLLAFWWTATVLPVCPAEDSPSRTSRMVSIKGGEFLMGSPNGEEGFSDEHPQRKVFVSTFLIDRYEVTNQEFLAFVRTTGHPPPANLKTAFTVWIDGRPMPGSELHPVVNVSWHDAVAYCHWAGKRLPTEAEWEKAARGPDGRRYPWGNEWDWRFANSASYWAERTVEFLNGEEWRAFWVFGLGSRISRERGLNGEILTLPVGSFAQGVSPYGLYDMAGNASEWVQDWYEPYAYFYTPLSDPQGPNGKLLKAVRGGSWLKPAKSMRTTDRDYGYPDDHSSGTGFRCAKDDR